MNPEEDTFSTLKIYSVVGDPFYDSQKEVWTLSCVSLSDKDTERKERKIVFANKNSADNFKAFVDNLLEHAKEMIVKLTETKTVLTQQIDNLVGEIDYFNEMVVNNDPFVSLTHEDEDEDESDLDEDDSDDGFSQTSPTLKVVH